MFAWDKRRYIYIYIYIYIYVLAKSRFEDNNGLVR